MFSFLILLVLGLCHSCTLTRVGDDISGYAVSYTSHDLLAAATPSTGKVRSYSLKNNAWEQSGQVTGSIPNGQHIDTTPGAMCVVSTEEGVVRVFVKANHSWHQHGEPIDTFASKGSPICRIIDKDTILFGDALFSTGLYESGRVALFEFFQGTWVQLGADIQGLSTGTQLGRDIALVSASPVTVSIACSNGVRTYQYKDLSWNLLGAPLLMRQVLSVSTHRGLLAVSNATSALIFKDSKRVGSALHFPHSKRSVAALGDGVFALGYTGGARFYRFHGDWLLKNVVQIQGDSQHTVTLSQQNNDECAIGVYSLGIVRTYSCCFA